MRPLGQRPTSPDHSVGTVSAIAKTESSAHYGNPAREREPRAQRPQTGAWTRQRDQWAGFKEISSSSCKSGPSCCPRWRAGLKYAHVELEVVRRTSTGMSTTGRRSWFSLLIVFPFFFASVSSFALCSCLGCTLPALVHSLPLCDLDGALSTTCCATQLRTYKSG